MRFLSLLLCLLLAFSCGELGERNERMPGEPLDDPGGPEPVVAYEARTEDPNEAEPVASGALPYKYVTLEDLNQVEGCSVLLKPEDGPQGDSYVLGFDSLEGVAQGYFDGTMRTMPYQAKADEGGGTVRYTHGNDEYEAITRIREEGRIGDEVIGVSGVVTVKRKSDGYAVTFQVVGEQGC